MNAKQWDKIAKVYHEEIVSPLRTEVNNPLVRKLKNVADKKNKIVADVGCGRGELLDLLAKQFKIVHAIDFSRGMIALARKASSAPNIQYNLKSFSELEAFENSCDVVLAINSVL